MDVDGSMARATSLFALTTSTCIRLPACGDSCDAGEMASRGPRRLWKAFARAHQFLPFGVQRTPALACSDRRNPMPGAVFGATDYARNCMKCNSRSS